MAAYRGLATAPDWLKREEAEGLLGAPPSGNVGTDQARHFIGQALGGLPALAPALERLAHEQAQEILAAHERVREAARARGVRQRVEPKLPVDVLGVYVYLPVGN